jgi:hypothetical protein
VCVCVCVCVVHRPVYVCGLCVRETQRERGCEGAKYV